MMLLTIPAGVYRIRNRITGEVYIGSGGNIYERIKGHVGLLKRGRHHNRRLQHDWTVYGAASFSFSILEVTQKNQAEQVAAENRWMNKYRNPIPRLYNPRPARMGCPPGRVRGRGMYPSRRAAEAERQQGGADGLGR